MQLEIKHLVLILVVILLIFSPLVLRDFVLNLFHGILVAFSGK